MISVFLSPLLQTKIKKQKALQKSAIQSAITRWQTGDKSAAGLILLYLKPTISSALRSFAPGQLNTLNIQAAKLALSSMSTYDPSKNVLPSTHAFNALQRLNRVRRLRLNIIHVPLDTVYKFNIIQQKSAQLLDLLGRLPTTLLLADSLGMSQKKILLITSRSNGIINDSLAVSLMTGQSTFSTKNVSDKDYIDYTYRSLGPILQKIMLWSLGLNGKKMLSNALIAKKLSISPGAVSQRRLKINNLLSLVRGLI